MKQTEEQQRIVSTIVKQRNGKIVLVDAGAGTGKSSTGLAIVDEIKPPKALYTAFNKAIVEEGREKFTSNVECKTYHALALSYVRPKLKIEYFSYLCIKEKLGYIEKAAIINVMDAFFRSSSTNMYDYFKEYLDDEKLEAIAANYVEGMVNDTVAPTFNFLLKMFHLMLLEGQVDPGYDMVIVDEIQDSTAVALEIFKLLKAPYKIGLGDQDQAIYLFMDLVNGFEVLEDTVILPLLKSFRCSTELAEHVQNFGSDYIRKDFVFKGTDSPIEDGLTAYITATNAGIISRINELHKSNQGYILTRAIKDIFACPLALVTAASGKEVYHKKYKFLEKEYRKYTLSGAKGFYSYLSKHVQDEEIQNAIKLLLNFKSKGVNIFDVMAKAKSIKKDRKVTVGTAFSLKGLGYSTVYVESDLNTMVGNILETGVETQEDLVVMKLYYVACTRCRKHLNGALHL